MPLRWEGFSICAIISDNENNGEGDCIEDYGYIDKLAERLSAYFDIEKDWEYENLCCDLYARSYIKNEKYFFSKKARVYGFENYEHCLVKYFPVVGMQELNGFTDSLKCAVDKLVEPHEEHMSSIVTGVMVVAQKPDADVVDAVKRFKYHKGFSFGFKGWVDIRLVLVHPQSGEVITNKKGKEVAKFYVFR